MDDELKLDKWYDHGPDVFTVDVVLSAGSHVLRFEQYEAGWTALARLSWALAPADHPEGAVAQGLAQSWAGPGRGWVVSATRGMSRASSVLEVAGSSAPEAMPDAATGDNVAGPWVSERAEAASVARVPRRAAAAAFRLMAPPLPAAPSRSGAPVLGGLPSAPPLANEAVEYYHLDALGSVRVVTDESGAVLRHHDFLPFGEEWEPSVPPSRDARLFTGKERDVESGLDYFGARYYRADLGRFTTADPAQALTAMNEAQRWNRYTYALNNPLSVVDPDGRWPFWIHNRILRAAFPQLNASQLQLLEKGSAFADSGSISNYGSAHAMLAFPGQSASDAALDMRRFIDDWELAAFEYRSLWHMGVALHPVMDEFSPPHDGYYSWLSTVPHFAGELYPSPAAQERAVQECRWEYAQRFRMEAYFLATGTRVAVRTRATFRGTIPPGVTIVSP